MFRFLSYFTHLSTAERRTGFVVCGAAVGLLVVAILGALVAHHLSPCNPRYVGRCGRRLAATLQGLDDLDDLDLDEDAAALCPSLTEAVDCYFWFSQRCLPAREQHFYSKVYVDISAVVEGLCSGSNPESAEAPQTAHPLLQWPCLRAARAQRWECTSRFFAGLTANPADQESPGRPEGDGGDILVESLYDPDAMGAFQAPVCRSLRDFFLCGLQLINDHCGLSLALQMQNLQDNLTSLIFSTKCDAELRPILVSPTVSLPAVVTVEPSPLRLDTTGFAILFIGILFVLIRRLSMVLKYPAIRN